MFTCSLFVATTILGALPPTADSVAVPPRRQAVKDSLSVREILTKFQTEKENGKVEMECLGKLMKIGPAAVPVLIESVKNEKTPPSTRALAIKALGFLGDVRARPVLLQAIDDKDVNGDARIALGRLGRLKENPKVRRLLAGEAPTCQAYFDLMFILTRDDQPNLEPFRKALMEYNTARMNSAQLGKPAPDFSLGDASGGTWKLRQFRREKAVLLIFLIGIN